MGGVAPDNTSEVIYFRNGPTREAVERVATAQESSLQMMEAMRQASSLTKRTQVDSGHSHEEVPQIVSEQSSQPKRAEKLQFVGQRAFHCFENWSVLEFFFLKKNTIFSYYALYATAPAAPFFEA